MDMNTQIKILEALLKKDENKECADCQSKTPRWASTSFGNFVCLRCSGFHRNLQVHITKIRSVNLDKWLPEHVEMYQYFNNYISNFYWEGNLPKNYNKPAQNASNSEVEQFIKDKYINKRWINSKMKIDPVSLYKQDLKKFKKYVKSLYEVSEEDEEEEDEYEKGSDSDEEPKEKKKKKDKKDKKSKIKEEKSKKDKSVLPPLQQPPQPTKVQEVKKPQQIDNLISFESKPKEELLFGDFQEGNSLINFGQPTQQQQQQQLFQQPVQADGFSTFQTASTTNTQFPQQFQQQQQQNTNYIPNLQDLKNMYNQSSYFNAQGGVNKYAALDAINYTTPNQFGQQQYQMNNSVGGVNNFGYGNANPTNLYGGGFNSTNATPYQQNFNMGVTNNNMNTNNMWGNMQSAQTQQNPQWSSQASLGSQSSFGSSQMNYQVNMMGTDLQQKSIPTNNGAPQINITINSNNYGNFQSAQIPTQSTQNSGFGSFQGATSSSSNNLYSGLVNLDNLGGNANSRTNNTASFGSNSFSGGSQTQQKKQSDAFSGLMTNQWS